MLVRCPFDLQSFSLTQAVSIGRIKGEAHQTGAFEAALQVGAVVSTAAIGCLALINV